MKIKLSDTGKIITGNTPKTSDENNYSSKDIPFVKPCDIDENEIIRIDNTEYWLSDYARSSARIIPANSVLVTCIGIIGKVAIAAKECAFNQQINAIVPYENKFLPEYISYAVLAKQKQLQEIANAPVVPIINKTQFSNIEIIERKIEEQRIIVNKLKKLSEIILNKKQQIEKLDTLVKSRFVEMFGDPVVNSMNWQRCRFDSLCENLDGRRRPITSTDRVEGPYPYYGASGIVDYVADYIFDEDILLISEDGANLLARSTPIAFSVSGRVWVNNHAHVVKFYDFALQKYIELYFAMISIEDYVTGSTQPKFNQAKLNGMMIPIPPKNRIEQFLGFIELIDKSKLVVQKSLEKLETLKKSLMQEYFG